MKSVESISAELMPPVPDHFFGRHSIAELQALTSRDADRLGRLSFPVILRAGQSHYERITWEEVFAIATTAFQKPPERIASYSSGRSSNEAAYLLQLMMRALGSNNLADCSDLCHAPSTVGLKQMFGTGTSVVSLESLKQADCVVLAGSNAAYNHPRLMNELIQIRDRGGTVIVINPVREVGLVKFASPSFPVRSLFTGSDIANVYLQPIPGSDVALFVGIQKALIERNQVDYEYLRAYTEGWEAVVQQAQTTSWSVITDTCGVDQGAITAAAIAIGQAEKVVFAWAMGITQQQNGVDNVYSIGNTALLTGNVGKVGAGVMPVRGHSNVQGFGSMGVTIRLKSEIQTALERLLGKPLSRVPGYDARALIEAAAAQQVDALLCLGGNLYGASPNLSQAQEALGNIDTVIYLATKPNLGHFHGLGRQQTLVLPVLNRFENPHRTTVESGNNFVRLNDAGRTHLTQSDLMAEVDFLTELAQRLLGTDPIDWPRLRETSYVRQLIAQTIPGYEKIADIDATREEFTISGRILTTPKFMTPSGKAALQVTPLPDLTLPPASTFGLPQPAKSLVLALMTGRSYAQHNTVVYQSGDKYRGIPHRHCILINREDAQSIDLAEHQRVTVKSTVGQLEQIEVIYGAVRRGAALMFYPEANAIAHTVIEKRSGTPAYKRVPVIVFSPA